jgi:hypothetical protein
MVLMRPEAWGRTFTLKELVRRGERAGPRRRGESPEAWIERVHTGRRRDDLVGSAEHDDVIDPMGGSVADFEATAAELDALVQRVVQLLFPPDASPAGSGGSDYSERTTAASP